MDLKVLMVSLLWSLYCCFPLYCGGDNVIVSLIYLIACKTVIVFFIDLNHDLWLDVWTWAKLNSLMIPRTDTNLCWLVWCHPLELHPVRWWCSPGREAGFGGACCVSAFASVESRPEQPIWKEWVVSADQIVKTLIKMTDIMTESLTSNRCCISGLGAVRHARDSTFTSLRPSPPSALPNYEKYQSDMTL